MKHRTWQRTVGVALLLTGWLTACGGDDGGGATAGAGGSGASSGAAGAGATGGGAAGAGGSAGTATGGSGGAAGSGGGTTGCLAGDFLQSVGKSHLLVGASMEDSIATQAPFDLRYLYLAGGLFDGSDACASCASGCTSGGQSCANSGPGCGWWGCWQYDQDPPGAYARNFFDRAEQDGQIPMITYYIVLPASGASEGAGEVVAANDASFMARYFADYRFLLKQVADRVVFLHIEPDFWGYAEQVDPDPTQIPAQVAGANATDCAGMPDTIAGMGQCLISMTRKYAKNAKVSLHGSGWATKIDVLQNQSASLDVTAEATKLGTFLAACGDADFVTVDASDRDAAWYDTQGQDRWWDDENQTLPNFTQAFTWAASLADTMQKPVMWWQVPVGNMSLPNQNQMWKDNRVDYLMAHMDEVASARGIGVAFGAGAGEQTNPSTDGGNLVTKVKAYGSAGGQAPCP